jgi:hypothetical protein
MAKTNEKKFIDLKVYLNKYNGQATVVLPKKKIGVPIPKKVRMFWNGG